MSCEKEQVKPTAFIRDLCKGMTEEEMLEAEENFRDYLMVVKKISDRLEREDSGFISVDE